MIRLLLTSGRGPGECRIALAKTLAVLAREASPPASTPLGGNGAGSRWTWTRLGHCPPRRAKR